MTAQGWLPLFVVPEAPVLSDDMTAEVTMLLSLTAAALVPGISLGRPGGRKPLDLFFLAPSRNSL